MIKEQDQEIYGCDGDVELADLLAHLFKNPETTEVEIQHPTDGNQVVTRERYEELCKALKDTRDMSPSERIQHKAQERRKDIKQLDRIKRDITGASMHIVDLEDDSADAFGKDIHGVELDLEGMMFFQREKYPDDIELKKNEIGCFMDPERKKPVLRICALKMPEVEGG